MNNLRLPLDLQLFAQEKTEPATPKKRQESRQKGQVAKSMEIPGAFILLFSFLFLYLFGGLFKEKVFQIFRTSFSEYILIDATQQNVMSIFSQIMVQSMIMAGPIFAISLVIGIVSNYMQVGFLLTGEPLMMKLNKLDPIEGAKRIFSLRSLVEFLKSISKMIIVGYVVYASLWGEKEQLILLSQLPLENLFSYMAKITLLLGVKIGIVLVVLALFDYMYQRYEHEKSIRMSKQDIKDEYKKTEGDPLIKGKIRERQRRMAMQRMMQEVPKADVVITNPTHFAVALKYDNGQMEAPVVIAKGQDYVALKIKEIAKENHVVTMENRPLARALYAKVDIGQSIPHDLFQAVAEVLAYVYKMKRKA